MKAAFNFLTITEQRANALFDVLTSVGQMSRNRVDVSRVEFIQTLLADKLTEYTYITVDGKQPKLLIDSNYNVRFKEDLHSQMDSTFERRVDRELCDLFAKWNIEDAIEHHRAEEERNRNNSDSDFH